MSVLAGILFFAPAFAQPDSLKSGTIKVRRETIKPSYLIYTQYDYRRFKDPGMEENPLELPTPASPDTVNYFRGMEDTPDAQDTLALLKEMRKRQPFDLAMYLQQTCAYRFTSFDTSRLDSVRVEIVVLENGLAKVEFIPWFEGDTMPAFAASVVETLETLWLWHPALLSSYRIPYKMSSAVILTIYAFDPNGGRQKDKKK